MNFGICQVSNFSVPDADGGDFTHHFRPIPETGSFSPPIEVNENLASIWPTLNSIPFYFLNETYLQ